MAAVSAGAGAGAGAGASTSSRRGEEAPAVTWNKNPTPLSTDEDAVIDPAPGWSDLDVDDDIAGAAGADAGASSGRSRLAGVGPWQVAPAEAPATDSKGDDGSAGSDGPDPVAWHLGGGDMTKKYVSPESYRCPQDTQDLVDLAEAVSDEYGYMGSITALRKALARTPRDALTGLANKLSSMNPALATVVRDNAAALQGGRDVGQCTLVMIGKSRSGKSDTINHMWRAESNVVPASNTKSRTTDINRSRILMKTNSGVARLTLVDTPGYEDGRGKEQDVANVALVQRFASSTYGSGADPKRAELAAMEPTLPPKSYPNAILLCINSTVVDTGAYTTTFEAASTFLQWSNLFDRDRPNLVVVGTFGRKLVALGETEDPVATYRAKAATFKSKVKDFYSQKLGVSRSDIRVAMVETKAVKMDKDRPDWNEQGFVYLPDGTASQLNLLNELVEVFKSSGDRLGTSTIGKFFSHGKAELKPHKAYLLPNMTTDAMRANARRLLGVAMHAEPGSKELALNAEIARELRVALRLAPEKSFSEAYVNFLQLCYANGIANADILSSIGSIANLGFDVGDAGVRAVLRMHFQLHDPDTHYLTNPLGRAFNLVSMQPEGAHRVFDLGSVNRESGAKPGQFVPLRVQRVTAHHVRHAVTTSKTRMEYQTKRCNELNVASQADALVVTVDAAGHYFTQKEQMITTEAVTLTYSHVFEVESFEVREYKITKEFKAALAELAEIVPRTFDEETTLGFADATAFQKFLGTWGAFVVVRVGGGGEITGHFSRRAEDFNEDNKSKWSTSLKAKVSREVLGGADVSFSADASGEADSKEAVDIEDVEASFAFNGGVGQGHLSSDALNEDTVEECKVWFKSLLERPVELDDAYRIIPVSQLVPTEWELRTKTALQHFLDQEIKKFVGLAKTEVQLRETQTRAAAEERLREIRAQMSENNCFAATSIAFVRGRGSVELHRLSLGDHVLCAHVDEGTERVVPCYAPVVAVFDANDEAPTVFKRITLADGRTLRATARHALFARRKGRLQSVLAESIAVGDIMVTIEASEDVHESAVVSVDEVVESGHYSVLTAEGTIVVDGTLATCFSDYQFTAANALYKPIRVVCRELVRWPSVRTAVAGALVPPADGDMWWVPRALSVLSPLARPFGL